jgi:hypothetical protein
MDNGEGSPTMQATVTTTRQFGFNRFGKTVMVLSIAAGVVISAVGSAAIDTLPTLRTSGQKIVLPIAHGSVNQGDGMLAGTSDVSAAVRAYTSDRQGEGIVGGNMTVSAPLVPHTPLGQGDGMLGDHISFPDLTPPIHAYDSPGMGEGWLATGQPDATVRAFSSEGQGEGWIGNGRP